MPRRLDATIPRRLPGAGAACLLAALTLLVPAGGTAQPAPEEPDPPAEHSSPYAAWDAGAYDQALEGFAERQTERPDDPELNLNVGAAHYKLDDFESADSQFYRAAAIGDDELRSHALYNLGNSAYRQGKLEDAIDFYRASLEANPDDVDAKFNLEFVREELMRRQQQNQGGQNRNENEDQEDQEEQAQQEGEGAQQQPEQPEDQAGEGKSPEGQQQQDERPEGGESPRDSDGDGIPDAEDSEPQSDESESGSQGDPREMPPGMTPEEAERYLQALEEGRPDPTRRGQRGRRSRQAKDW